MENYPTQKEKFAHECRIRDCFADNLHQVRPNERFVLKEARCDGQTQRADLWTVDEKETFWVYEFEIKAHYEALGQILTYVAQKRVEEGFNRRIRGAIAAFECPEPIRLAIEVMNLGIEFVQIPHWMRNAGHVPQTSSSPILVPAPLLRVNTVQNK